MDRVLDFLLIYLTGAQTCSYIITENDLDGVIANFIEFRVRNDHIVV